MKGNQYLLACLDKIGSSNIIKARFFYVFGEKAKPIVTEVTWELCEMIKERNKLIDNYIKKTGFYEPRIPYEYRNGFAHYPYGCGLTHYLNNDCLNLLEIFRKPYSKFPIGLCQGIRVWTASDLSDFYKIENIGQINDLASEIQQVLRNLRKNVI